MADDPFLTFSASLPLRQDGDWKIAVELRVRPWNGRVLTEEEVQGAWWAADEEFWDTGSFGMAAQAAHEWLSEHAW
jgi:hypothetical protein